MSAPSHCDAACKNGCLPADAVHIIVGALFGKPFASAFGCGQSTRKRALSWSCWCMIQQNLQRNASCTTAKFTWPIHL